MGTGLDWEEQSECRKRGIPPSEFYPSTGRPGHAAVSACHACAVRGICGETAKRRREHGYWAGEMLAYGVPLRRADTSYAGSLRDRMSSKGLTIRALAAALDIPTGTVSRWAAGAHVPGDARRASVEKIVGPVVWGK